MVTAHGIPIRNIWHMLLYCWGETGTSPYWTKADTEQAPGLDSLLSSILVKLVQQRMRIGLAGNYVPEQRLLKGIRGRVQFTESLKRRAFEQGRAYCEFEEYSINAPKNQIIRSTLFYLAREGEFGPDKQYAFQVRHSLRSLVRALDEIELIELTPTVIHREQIGRHDHDYRIMLSICDLIQQQRMPTEQPGASYASKSARDQLVLFRVYQKFVSNFYKHHLSGWKVSGEVHLSWHNEGSTEHLPVMIPDLILTKTCEPNRRIVLDTKFTAKSIVENQWGKTVFDSSHLYQLYAYLRTQEDCSPTHKRTTGILLYPAINKESPGRIKLSGHELRIEYVNLADEWQAIEHTLLDLVNP